METELPKTLSVERTVGERPKNQTDWEKHIHKEVLKLVKIPKRNGRHTVVPRFFHSL